MHKNLMATPSRYRHDIDGLRAIAVTSVVFFHLMHGAFPQGFLGVDIFFVISGYLITTIIWREAQENSFSYKDFYERRLRRLAPALLVLLLFVSFFSFLILLPSDLASFGKSVLSTIFFSANIYFWRDTNYFSSAAEQKPLLHMWSLSVEEQFYIFFPIVILLIVKWRGIAFPAILALTGLSFLVNVFLIDIGGASPAFYLLPSRAWEMGLGAAVAVCQPFRWSEASRIVLRYFSFLLIAIGLFYDGPWLTLVPVGLPVVLGSALLIWVGAPVNTILGRLLALSPVNFIGKISYSLYLWHWPVIVFFNYYLVRSLNLVEIIFAALMSVVLGVLSWKYVERPFRGTSLPSGKLFAMSSIGAAASAMIAVLFVTTGGMGWRLSAEAALINSSVGTHFRCPISEMRAFGASRACDLSLEGAATADTQVVLLGNSHAQMYAPVVRDELQLANKKGILVPLNACIPTLTVNISKECRDDAIANFEAVMKLPNIETIVVSFDWPTHTDLFESDGSLIPTAQRAQKLLLGVKDLATRTNGLRVIVVGPIFRPSYNVPSILSRQIAFGKDSRIDQSAPSSGFYLEFEDIFDGLGDEQLIQFIRPDLIQCSSEECFFVKEGLSLYADDSHIAAPALHILAPAFSEMFSKRSAE